MFPAYSFIYVSCRVLAIPVALIALFVIINLFVAWTGVGSFVM